MKKVIGILLLALATLPVTAQEKTSQPLTVHLGKLPSPHMENGKIAGIHTTRTALLASELLIADEPTYVVKEYTFSFIAKGKDFLGPFKTKGNVLKADFKNVISENEAGTVFLENIVVDCGGILRTAPTIILKYD